MARLRGRLWRPQQRPRGACGRPHLIPQLLRINRNHTQAPWRLSHAPPRALSHHAPQVTSPPHPPRRELPGRRLLSAVFPTLLVRVPRYGRVGGRRRDGTRRSLPYLPSGHCTLGRKPVGLAHAAMMRKGLSRGAVALPSHDTRATGRCRPFGMLGPVSLPRCGVDERPPGGSDLTACGCHVTDGWGAAGGVPYAACAPVQPTG